MLVEVLLGDAYGAGFEYDDPSPGRPNDLSGYVQNRAHPDLRPGRYTDDGQMSLAVAEALVAAAAEERLPTRGEFLRAFWDAFARDPRKGYSRRFQALLEDCRDADDLARRLAPDSEKSGGAMRACPCGVLPRVEDVLEAARVQASVTHDTPRGIAAAQGAALMAHYLLHGLGPRSGLPAFLAAHVPGPAWQTPWTGRVGSLGLDSVRAALAAVTGSGSLSEVLARSVGFGGDVDTVAAVAMGAASGSAEFARDVPEALLLGLEDGPYGRAYAQRLDRDLLALAGFAPGGAPRP